MFLISNGLRHQPAVSADQLEDEPGAEDALEAFIRRNLIFSFGHIEVGAGRAVNEDLVVTTGTLSEPAARVRSTFRSITTIGTGGKA